MKFKISIMISISLLLYAMVFFISWALPLIAEHKTNFSQSMLLEWAIDLFRHPVTSAKLMYVERNPFFILGMIAATVFIVYTCFKMFSNKDYENVSDRYGVQGTSRFAHPKEIFRGNEIIGLQEDKLNEVILKSMSKKE